MTWKVPTSKFAAFHEHTHNKIWCYLFKMNETLIIYVCLEFVLNGDDELNEYDFQLWYFIVKGTSVT